MAAPGQGLEINMISKIYYLNNFPKPIELAEFPILIYDKNLLKNKKTKIWIESFSNKIGVNSGENLKQFREFEKNFVKVLNLVEKTKTKNLTLVAVGGGSVGDFTGFLASVFKRGVPLIHIPSTWLAAIDSSHGGKTAINVAGYKNQMGSFYPATKIYLIKYLLFTQPHIRMNEAMGEILKTVLLCGGSLWRQASQIRRFNKTILWRLLPKLIQYKNKIVKADPFEKKDIRLYLNLGHTIGHALESLYCLPHGIAVNYGLRLDLEFFLSLNKITKNEYTKIISSPLMAAHLKPIEAALKLTSNQGAFEKHFLQDKKVSGKKYIKYVFLNKIGKPYVEDISITELHRFIKNS